MFVKRYGNGPRVFFCLHGWNANHRSFEPLLPYLPPDVTLYVPDLPGCGLSPRLKTPCLDSLTDEIVQAFETPRTSFTLVGHCTGALLGMHAGLACPRLIERLVLIDTFAEWPWYFRIFTMPTLGRYAYASTFANPMGRWIANAALASRRSSESNFTQGFVGIRHDANLQYLNIVKELDSAEHFASLQVPVDVIFGSRTFQAVRTSASIWKRMWPQCSVWELPRTGHLALREAAPAISEIVFQGGVCRPSAVLTSSSTQF